MNIKFSEIKKLSDKELSLGYEKMVALFAWASDNGFTTLAKKIDKEAELLMLEIRERDLI